EVLAALEGSLRADFGANAASLQLYTEVAVTPLASLRGDFLHVSVRSPEDVPDDLRRLLAGRKPLCGRFRAERMTEVFGERADGIESTALLPLAVGGTDGRLLGLLAIGSHSEERF